MVQLSLKQPDSADDTKEFFDKYFTEKISFPANEVDAVVGFFQKRGFNTSSSTGVATVLLQQSKIDEVNVFTLLDTLSGLEDVQISNLVAEVLNFNRAKISTLGFKIDTTEKKENRNIVV